MNFNVPLRMLVIGLPLTIGLGMIVAYLLNPESGLAMALLTAAVLTPTDAALGQTVVTSADVVLSRFRAAPSARLDRRPFESERAFPTHFWLG